MTELALASPGPTRQQGKEKGTGNHRGGVGAAGPAWDPPSPWMAVPCEAEVFLLSVSFLARGAGCLTGPMI